MKLTFSVISFSLLVLFACKQTSNGVVKYGVNQSFKLIEAEREVAATKEVIKEYESTCVPHEYSLPINRVIKADNYSIFICFADSSLTANLYCQSMSQDSTFTLLSRRDTIVLNQNVQVMSYKKSAIFVTEYWKGSKVKGMQEVFTLITRDSGLARKSYEDTQSFLQRVEF